MTIGQYNGSGVLAAYGLPVMRVVEMFDRESKLSPWQPHHTNGLCCQVCHCGYYTCVHACRYICH